MPSITVGVAPVLLLNRNAKRMTATIRNQSAAGQIIFFWLQGPDGLTVTNADYVLGVSEEKYFIKAFDGPDIQGPIAAVADGAAGTVFFAETAEGEGGAK